MASCLAYYGIKDVWEPNCEHCNREHVREIEIEGITTIKVRTQCDTCNGAEESLSKIRNIIAKTIRARDNLSPKQEDERKRCDEILKMNREKREVVLSNIRRYFAEGQQLQPNTRTPHND